MAYEWFRKIKREMPFGADLKNVIADGDDITEKAKEIEKALFLSKIEKLGFFVTANS